MIDEVRETREQASNFKRFAEALKSPSSAPKSLLPQPWEVRWSHQHNAWYYHNPATNTRQSQASQDHRQQHAGTKMATLDT